MGNMAALVSTSLIFRNGAKLSSFFCCFSPLHPPPAENLFSWRMFLYCLKEIRNNWLCSSLSISHQCFASWNLQDQDQAGSIHWQGHSRVISTPIISHCSPKVLTKHYLIFLVMGGWAEIRFSSSPSFLGHGNIRQTFTIGRVIWARSTIIWKLNIKGNLCPFWGSSEKNALEFKLNNPS